MNKNFVANITANVNKFIANINRAQAAANKLQDNVTVDVEANTAAATAQISKFRLMLKSIPNKFRVRGDVDTSAISKMNLIRTAMANAGKGVETLRSKIGLLPSAFLALAPAAIPVLASIVPAVMAIGNALAVVGGGAIGLVGAFGIAGAGAMAFGAMAMTAYKMLQDGTIQATAQTRAFQTALASLKTQWQSLVQANSGAIFTTMTNGINIAKTALSGLTPFITGVANSMSTLSAKMLSFFQTSSIANNFFAMFNTIGVQAFNNVMNAVGQFGAGFMALITQFGPLFSWMAQGLANMSAQFQAWATSVSTANGIKTFISYVQTNLPLIGQIFGNVFTGIFNLFKAFGTNSQTIFQSLAQMSAKFAQWSATIGQSQGFKQFIDYVQTNGPTIMSTIGNIVTAVIAFATAMAPVGAAVMSVVSSIAQWVASFATAHPQITMVIGAVAAFIGAVAQIAPIVMSVVSGITTFVSIVSKVFNVVKMASMAFTLLSSPIGIAIVAIVAIGAALYLLWTKCETFRNGVMILVGVMQTLGSAIMSGLGAAFTWIGQQLQVVMGVLSAFGSFLMGVFAGAWNGLVTVVQTVWTAISTAVTTGIQLIIAGITAFGSMVMSVFGAAWNGIVMIVTTVWNTIVTIISTVISTVVSVVSSGFNMVVSTVSSIMSSVFSVISSIWNSIVSTVTSVISNIVSFVSSGFSNMLSTASSIMSSIFSAVSSAWSNIVSTISNFLSQAVSFVINGFSQMISAVVDFAGQLVSNISRAMSDFVNRVMEGGSNAVNAITDACSNMISAISGFVGDMASAGMDLVKGFINGIKDMAGEAVAAAKNMASEAVATVKSFLKIGSPSKVLKQIGQWLAQGFAIGIEKDIPRVATAVERMLRPVTKGLAKLKTANYGNAQEGASSVYSLMAENMKEATKKIEEIIDKRKSLSKKIAEANKSLAKNMSIKARAAKISNLNKLKAQYVKLGKIAHGQYMKRAKNRNLIREVRPMLIYMTRIAKKREAIAKQLEKAQDKLQAALDKKTDFKNAIRNDLRGYASIMNTGRKTSQGMVKMMTKRLDEIKKYEALIGSLKKRGLNKDTLKEILDAGIEQGSVIAKGLFVGGQDAIKQVNILQSQINKASANMGDANAKHFYQAGVDAAKGIVNGLKAQEKYLKSVAVKIADVISSTIKKRLKIHSPSRVMLDLMRYVGAGLVNGLNTAAKLSAKAASAISAGIESNIDPNVHIADIKTASDLKGLNSTVTQSMITDMSNEDNKNITIVLKSDTDLPAVKTYIERVQGINSGVRILRKS
ncbi:hypothetical protein BFS35_010995 [Macrococcoides goetzii]|uniref:Phage tail protein n=1 Tax=Macrococcoides goetzii TaxID=1891097 RepID=A0A2G5NUT5_9STAP|nr:hypothetical protein [Macrococcus goetzii]RAI79665.1 hypothetical protein BFS35_010995 [Macrococcus goetzii]